MAISAKLELRQGQQLVMTPQLQQAIRLLQLSNIELTQFVEGELERNPLLEREDRDEGPVSGDGGEEQGAREDDRGVSQPESGDGDRSEKPEDRDVPDTAWGDDDDARGSSDSYADSIAELDLAVPSTAAEHALDADYSSVDPDASSADAGNSGGLAESYADDSGLGSWTSVSGAGGTFEDDDGDLERFVADVPSLSEHLEVQLGTMLADPADRLIARHMIDCLDESGYLRTDLDELARTLGASRERVDRVLVSAQQCEPTGIFARSLAECLALQLKEQNRYDPQIAALLDNLHLLAEHNLPALRRAIGCDAEELADMVHEIKRLDPRPGLAHGGAPIQPVVPDVIVRAAKDGSWRVELNSDTLPKVLVNRAYYTTVSRATRTEQDKGYLLECLQSASWLVKSLDQRARTILRVAEEIVRQQDGFLTWGVQHLRPLNLRTIADALSLHESTVSRVTSNKHIATPRGIFDLKYFFTSALAQTEGGEAHSSEAVRHRIKQMIDGEAVDAVLSDDKLVDRLREEGIDIARRTVAKYRDSLRIPSSVERRRMKRLKGARASPVRQSGAYMTARH